MSLNFVSIGACDGQAEDASISSFMRKNNWNGLFVEPMSLNHRDFKNLLESNNATDRAFLLHAAANETCTNATIKFTRPNAEEKQGLHFLDVWKNPRFLPEANTAKPASLTSSRTFLTQ